MATPIGDSLAFGIWHLEFEVCLVIVSWFLGYFSRFVIAFPAIDIPPISVVP